MLNAFRDWLVEEARAVPRGQRAGLNAQEHRVAQAGRAAPGTGPIRRVPRSRGGDHRRASFDGQDGGRGAPHEEFT